MHECRVYCCCTTTAVPTKRAQRLPQTDVPLQSIKSIHNFRNLLPDFEATLMTFTRSTERSNQKLVLYWLSTPSTDLSAGAKPEDVSWGIRFRSYAHRGEHSPMTFCSPLEHYHGYSNRKRAISSPEVWFPNSAKQWKFTCSGVTSPGTFRLQVFSTSWRLAPLTALWPYFMPLALAGFTLQSFPLESSIAPSSDTITYRVLHRFSITPRRQGSAGG